MGKGLTMKRRFAAIVGTRPEAIKMAPLVIEARERRSEYCEVVLVSTGQHREMVSQVLRDFSLAVDVDLDLMSHNQGLCDITARIVSAVGKLLSESTFDMVLVQGDTSTAFGAALAAFFHRVPLAHIEAGLRTRDLHAPFPEEMNRKFVDIISDWYFAPTEMNRANLLEEDIAASKIRVTGNTVIDALYHTIASLERKGFVPPLLRNVSRVVSDQIRDGQFFFVTAHRRESFGVQFENLCHGLREVAWRHPHMLLLYPVHPNPNVRSPAERYLTGVKNILLVDPFDYQSTCYFLARARLVISDSGGLQEEAPALGKKIVILRDTTERPEVVSSGWGVLAGTDAKRIVECVESFLVPRTTLAANPFGDGTASRRIMDCLLDSEELAQVELPFRPAAQASVHQIH